MVQRFRILMTLLIIVYVVLFGVLPAAAEDSVGTPIEQPVGVQVDKQGTPAQPSLEEHGACVPTKNQACPEHWSGYAHTHYVDGDRTPSYIGWYDYGTEFSCTVSGQAGCTFSTSTTKGWSNTWNATIGFSPTPINASVGGNVTASGTATYSLSLGPYYNGKYQLRYQPTYRFHELNVHTDVCSDTACWTEWGQSSARVYQYTNWYVKKIG